jgi:hypothetical protein
LIITFLRSSSYGAHKICPLSYYLNYTLGIRSPSGKAAAKGNIVHKALEVLAWQSYHRERGNATFSEETFGELVTDEVSPDVMVDRSYAYYKGLEPQIRWNDRLDYRDCRDWTHLALDSWGGRFDPRKLKVITPEKKFDFVLDEPWARYRFDTPEGVVEGQLGLKGTIDLITEDRHDPQVYEVIDWKTGQRRDWSVEDESKATKGYADLARDFQLNLYFLAMAREYPAVETFVTTIVYIRSGGPYRLYFDRSDLPRIRRQIREKFEEIRDTPTPKPRFTKACSTFCHYGKTASERDPSRTLCQFFQDELRRCGTDAVTAEHGKPGAYSAYGDGGGRREGE